MQQHLHMSARPAARGSATRAVRRAATLLHASARSSRLGCRASAQQAASSAPGVIPQSPKETVEQAAAACRRAWAAGVRRHRVELLLPLIGATDIDDWPGGIQQQFKAAGPCWLAACAAAAAHRCTLCCWPGVLAASGVFGCSHHTPLVPAAPMVEQLLQSLRQQEGLQGGLKGEVSGAGGAPRRIPPLAAAPPRGSVRNANLHAHSFLPSS